MRILAIIPARGGSKGIPRKNLIDLCGRPLIAWSIDFGIRLVQAGVVARCIVSTDDDEIARVSVSLGADVPFMRPHHAASDHSKATEYVLHAIDKLSQEGEAFDAVMILQPTSPIRDLPSVQEAVRHMIDTRADSLISCYEEEYINDLVLYECVEGNRLKPLNPAHNRGVRRQDHGSLMVRNGAIYVTRVAYLNKSGNLICDQPTLLRMTKMDSVCVDTYEDLEILRERVCK